MDLSQKKLSDTKYPAPEPKTKHQEAVDKAGHALGKKMNQEYSFQELQAMN